MGDPIKLRVAITGTTWGIGAAVVASTPAAYEIIGLDRAGEAGMPDPTFMQNIMNVIVQTDPDVFINNAYGGGSPAMGADPNPQLTLFRNVLDLWRGKPSKTIINICSIAAYYAKVPVDTGANQYRQNKFALLTASEQATLNCLTVRCRVSALSPGYVKTRRTDGERHQDYVMMEDTDAANYVWWLIQQPPGFRIPHLSVFAVNVEGINRKS